MMLGGALTTLNSVLRCLETEDRIMARKRRNPLLDQFLGKWRITETEAWGQDALDLLGVAHLEIEPDGMGTIQLIAIRGGIDCRAVERDGVAALEFCWDGISEGDSISGRGCDLPPIVVPPSMLVPESFSLGGGTKSRSQGKRARSPRGPAVYSPTSCGDDAYYTPLSSVL